MRAKILYFLIFPIFSFAQDYVVDEIFEPNNYSSRFSQISSNHRLIYSWGLNVNDTKSNIIKEKGSNFFDLRYQKNVKILDKVFLTLGLGYNWNSYNLVDDINSFYIDSIFYDKRKFRFQNILSAVGLRFQSSASPDNFWFVEVDFFNDFLTKSTFLNWIEISNMNYKTKISKLNFIKNYQFGMEIRCGYKNISLFSRYRHSKIINDLLIGNELPNLTIGLQFDIPVSGKF